MNWYLSFLIFIAVISIGTFILIVLDERKKREAP